MTASRPEARDLSILAGPRTPPESPPDFLIQPTAGPVPLAAYHRARRLTFVDVEGLFASTDHDDIDDDPRTIVLVATDRDGEVLGGVRLAPVGSTDIGWWTGSRLVVRPDCRTNGIGPALVRAACAYAESRGVLRFEATVQSRYEVMFSRIGWERVGDCTIAGQPHVSMRWPLNPIQRLASATKSMLADVLGPLRNHPLGLGPSGFRGDDGSPVPGCDLIAACDAIIPSMVERDPEWAGWCSVLVNINDISAMGARPVGLLDAVGAPTTSLLTRIVRGVAKGAQAWNVPVLGGHSQVGVPASLAVTALGSTNDPVRAGGGGVGDQLRLTADLAGGWRPGYRGRQWDSSSGRTPDELATMTSYVARTRPKAAKDISMAGIVGTTGMLAEACGTGAELDVARIPRPAEASMGDWLTCFPGFAMITADTAGAAPANPGAADSAGCGRLTSGAGVALRWPDGTVTQAISTTVTGLGRA
jgi:putative N-acetyltransferase (TIGR04045 family)